MRGKIGEDPKYSLILFPLHLSVTMVKRKSQMMWTEMFSNITSNKRRKRVNKVENMKM
jgi:hypothetical protein